MIAKIATFAVLSACVLTGCGSRREISGGTVGLLRVDGQPVGDVLISVHHHEQVDARPLGIAITDEAGRFELRTQDPVAPLSLYSGTYRFTVESVGDIYLEWPPAFSDPSDTPIVLNLTSSGQSLVIDVPRPKVAR